MESTLHDLTNLLIQAIPTVVFFLFLTFYLKQVYFRPLAKILDERHRATEGVRELSQRAFEAADQKSSEFERALQLARAEINQENEALRQKWAQEQMETVAKARAEAEQARFDGRAVHDGDPARWWTGGHTPPSRRAG